MNLKKVYRPYRQERLVVRRRGGRKRALGARAPAAVPQGANQRWSLDFVSDALNDGRRFRVLNIVDNFTRECLAAAVDTSLASRWARCRAWPRPCSESSTSIEPAKRSSADSIVAP